MTQPQQESLKNLRFWLGKGGCHRTITDCVQALKACDWDVYRACLWLADHQVLIVKRPRMYFVARRS
jgi:hypothetical protein